MDYVLSTELSEQETNLIGSIVCQWGFIENEIFQQTLFTFEDDEPIPASMKKNLQFSSVLQLWLKRVAEKNTGPKKEVLLDVYQKLIDLNDFRQAIVHSRWEWNPHTPDEITAVRAHRETVTRVRFNIKGLSEFSNTLGKIRFSLRYPGGPEDLYAERTGQVGHMSRWFWESVTDKPSQGDE